jgi:hypothetical protein
MFKCYTKKVFKDRCFRCIRKTEYSDKYEFVYECSHAVMLKMNEEERLVLAKSVLSSIRMYSEAAEFDELVLLGDSFARVYMFMITRSRYLTKTFQSCEEVARTLRIASEKSMPAWLLCDTFETGTRKMPECWVAAYK